MRQVTLEAMESLLLRYKGRYTAVVGFKPTGWSHAGGTGRGGQAGPAAAAAPAQPSRSSLSIKPNRRRSQRGTVVLYQVSLWVRAQGSVGQRARGSHPQSVLHAGLDTVGVRLPAKQAASEHKRLPGLIQSLLEIRAPDQCIPRYCTCHSTVFFEEDVTGPQPYLTPRLHTFAAVAGRIRCPTLNTAAVPSCAALWSGSSRCASFPVSTTTTGQS